MDKALYWIIGYLLLAVIHFLLWRAIKKNKIYEGFDFILGVFWPCALLTVGFILIVGWRRAKKIADKYEKASGNYGR